MIVVCNIGMRNVLAYHRHGIVHTVKLYFPFGHLTLYNSQFGGVLLWIEVRFECPKVDRLYGGLTTLRGRTQRLPHIIGKLV